MFTGSTATGKAIIKSSADTVKRLTLELGGNDAGIVLPDADPKAIAEGLFWGAFINTGQTCAALKRLYVHTDIYDAVCDELTTVAAAMPMGNGLDENNVLGPLQNRAQFDIVARLVEAARDSGARILIGGNPETDTPGNFYPTTLVADIENTNPLVAEEQFGPALPIIRYTTVDEAITMANGLDVGLGASVWSADPADGPQRCRPPGGRHRVDQQTRRRGPPHPLRRRQTIRLRPRIRRRRPQSPRCPPSDQRLRAAETARSPARPGRRSPPPALCIYSGCAPGITIRSVSALSLPQRLTRAVGESPAAERVAVSLETVYGPVIGWAHRSPLHTGVLGHSVHPPLTDVTLGCWLSASILDLAGGPQARRSATLLVGAGLAAAGPTAIAGTGDWAEMTGAERRIGAVHALGTDVAVVLFLGSLIARTRGHHALGAKLGLAGNAVWQEPDTWAGTWRSADGTARRSAADR